MRFTNILGKWGIEEYLHALEAQGGIEPPINVLQVLGLPFGDSASIPI